MLPKRDPLGVVVVCEDDEPTLELLCDHLTADNFEVVPAPSAADGSPACWATRAFPPASRLSLTGLSAAASIASLPLKWWYSAGPVTPAAAPMSSIETPW